MIPSSYWDLFHLSPGGVSIATDSTCKEIRHNRKAARLLRIGHGDNFSHSADHPPPVKVIRGGVELSADKMPMQRSARLGIEVTDEVLEFVWDDNVRFFTTWNTKPIFDESGERICGVIATSEDITPFIVKAQEQWLQSEQLKQLIKDKVEDQLQLRRELERLDRINHVAQMAAGISHEVRNPITTVRGFLQLLNSKYEYERDAEFFSLMISELDRANDILSNFLSLTRTQEEDVVESSLKEAFFAVSPLLEADALMAGKQLVFVHNPQPDLKFQPKEVQQLLLNLVKNGLEATPVGGKVTVETIHCGEHAGFTVTDEGDGIPDHMMEKLGTPFLTTKAGGTGLGLSICFDIAERHNGKLNVSSGKKGTTFTFLLRCP